MPLNSLAIGISKVRYVMKWKFFICNFFFYFQLDINILIFLFNYGVIIVSPLIFYFFHERINDFGFLLQEYLVFF